MLKTASSYLRQTSPTCKVASWSLNRAVDRAMAHVKLDKEYSVPDFFADTEPNQFAPWPIHERLAFGQDLMPVLHCQVVRLPNSLTSLLLLKSFPVRLWALASLRVIAGNPFGKIEIVKRRLVMREIFASFQAPNPGMRQMAYTIMLSLSENWFAIEELQNRESVRLILSTILSLSSDDIVEHGKSLVCLLRTLSNLVDHKIGVLKAIRYDLFELRWLLSCGMKEVEKAILNVFVRVSKNEIGRLGLRYKHVAKLMLAHFYNIVDEGGDPTQVGTMLMFSTLPNNERDGYSDANTVSTVMEVFQEPTLSSISRLVLVKLLTNLAETPRGRASIKEHLQFLVSVPICDPVVQESMETLIRKILWNP